MAQAPKLSIIIPVYNVENYLRECLDSILNQSFQDFELILVDDGSTDSSSVICDEYARQDSRITVFHQENKGLAAARNVGLDYIKERDGYVMFVDSDDSLAPGTLEKNMALIEKLGDRAMLFFPYEEFGQGETRKYQPAEKILGNVSSAIDEVPVMAWVKIYDNEIFRDLRFVPGMYAEDLYLYPEVLRRTRVVGISSEGCYRYRQHASSITHGVKYSLLDGCCKGFVNVMAYKCEHGMKVNPWKNYHSIATLLSRANLSKEEMSALSKELQSFRPYLNYSIFKKKNAWMKHIFAFVVIHTLGEKFLLSLLVKYLNR